MSEPSATAETNASEAPPPDSSASEAPAPDSTEAADTTAAAQSATPTLSDVSVTVEPDDGAEHHPNSVQVPKDTVLTLNWSTSDAAGVRIDPLGSFGPSGCQQISTEDATFTLVPLGDDGLEGPSWPLEIHTHDPGEVVSPHTDVTSGVAKIVSFQALSGGNPVDGAKVGDSIELTLLASDGCDSAKIDDQEIELSNTADGHQTGKLTVTLTADMNGSFSAEVSQAGDVADSASLQLDIEPLAKPPAAHLDPIAGPVNLGGKIQISWIIDNYQQGMQVQLSCDPDPGDDGFTAAGQDLTSSLKDDGSGSLEITPAKAASPYTFTLNVTPPGADAVQDSQTVEVDAPAPVPHLQPLSGPVHPGDKIAISWTIENFLSGMMVQLSCDPDPVDPAFTAAGQDVSAGLDDHGAGSLDIFPTQTPASYDFTLSVTPQGGEAASDKQTVEITPAKPLQIDSFKAAPSDGSQPATGGDGSQQSTPPLTVASGTKVKLSWSISGDGEFTLSIDNGVGDVSCNAQDASGQLGSTEITFTPPDGQTQLTYTLTLTPKDTSQQPSTAQVALSVASDTKGKLVSAALGRGALNDWMSDEQAKPFKAGDSGPAVTLIRLALRWLGNANISPLQGYNSTVANAVKAFQNQQLGDPHLDDRCRKLGLDKSKLQATGKFDKITAQLMDQAVLDKVQPQGDLKFGPIRISGQSFKSSDDDFPEISRRAIAILDDWATKNIPYHEGFPNGIAMGKWWFEPKPSTVCSSSTVGAFFWATFGKVNDVDLVFDGDDFYEAWQITKDRDTNPNGAAGSVLGLNIGQEITLSADEEQGAEAEVAAEIEAEENKAKKGKKVKVPDAERKKRILERKLQKKINKLRKGDLVQGWAKWNDPRIADNNERNSGHSFYIVDIDRDAASGNVKRYQILTSNSGVGVSRQWRTWNHYKDPRIARFYTIDGESP